MATFEQDEFGGGMYRGRKAPAGSAYDLLNALIDDESQPFLRGKTTYYSASDTAEVCYWLNAIYAPAPAANRVLLLGPNATYVLNGSLAPVQVSSGRSIWGRMTSIGAYAIAGLGSRTIFYYAGSLKGTDYSTGTVSVTAGSATVTGSGTSWLANVDAGMIFSVSSLSGLGVVKSVDSNTQITLLEPWGGSTGAGATYSLSADRSVGLTSNLADVGTYLHVAAAGAGSPRLLAAIGNRIYFSPPGDPFTFASTDYHEVPANALIVGMEGMGDSALIFTTRGVWRISNLSFDPVDDAGNVQHIVEQVNKDVVLWDDLGIAVWDQGLVLPAIDDVYLFGLDGEARSVSGSIRPLYRSYVKAGYQPGMAGVHRGHYILPILNGASLVDVLVCRLDRPFQTPSGRVFFPWTRWQGHAAGSAYATFVSEATRSPKLLGLDGVRVTDLTNCMDKTSASTQDANSTTPTFTVETNDVDLGPGIRPNTAEKIRAVYETTGGTPTIDMHSAVGPEGATYTAATLKRGGGSSTGTDYSAWKVARKAERIRFRFKCESGVQSLILRRLEVTIRPAGQT